MLGLRKMIAVRAVLIPLEIATVALSTYIALPYTLAIAPQKMSLKVADLEPEFQNLKDKKGQPITELFANKGL